VREYGERFLHECFRYRARSGRSSHGLDCNVLTARFERYEREKVALMDSKAFAKRYGVVIIEGERRR
jgi:hypothetical protein